MHIIYGVCFYFGSYRKQNIIDHIQIFKDLCSTFSEHTFDFCITCMIDESDPNKRQIETLRLYEDFNELKNIKCTLLHNFNSSGTLQGLDDLFTHFNTDEYKNSYVFFFEEDFLPINLLFLNDSIDLLKSDEYIYIGESTTGKIKSVDSRPTHSKDRLCRLYNSNTEVWTDGGYYATTIKRLQKVKEKLGDFHIGNKTTKYEKVLDGVDYGEVGFPTRLHHEGFVFKPLFRRNYFVHYEKRN